MVTQEMVSSMSIPRSKFFTSIYYNSMSKCTNNIMIILKESFDKIIEKVSLKSILFFQIKSCTIRKSLNLSTLPFNSQLVLNIHLQPMNSKPSSGQDLKSHVLNGFIHVINPLSSNRTLYGLMEIK